MTIFQSRDTISGSYQQCTRVPVIAHFHQIFGIFNFVDFSYSDSI